MSCPATVASCAPTPTKAPANIPSMISFDGREFTLLTHTQSVSFLAVLAGVLQSTAILPPFKLLLQHMYKKSEKYPIDVSKEKYKKLALIDIYLLRG